MRIVAYTYVDHQAEIGYPIRLVTRNLSFCDAIHFFGSDSGNTILLESERSSHPLRDRISCHQINRTINIPADIAAAQNACLEWIRKNETFDFAIGLQADTMLSPRAMDLIVQLCETKHLSSSIMLPVDHVRVYAVAHRSRFGCSLIGKDSKALFVEDGAYTKPYVELPDQDKDPALYAIDVGYYTPEMYYRHVKRNARTWQSAPGESLAASYATNRDEFIRSCLQKVKSYERQGAPLTAVDASKPEHAEIMEYFQCRDDFRHVLGIIEELRRGA